MAPIHPRLEKKAKKKVVGVGENLHHRGDDQVLRGTQRNSSRGSGKKPKKLKKKKRCRRGWKDHGTPVSEGQN